SVSGQVRACAGGEDRVGRADDGCRCTERDGLSADRGPDVSGAEREWATSTAEAGCGDVQDPGGEQWAGASSCTLARKDDSPRKGETHTAFRPSWVNRLSWLGCRSWPLPTAHHQDPERPRNRLRPWRLPTRARRRKRQVRGRQIDRPAPCIYSHRPRAQLGLHHLRKLELVRRHFANNRQRPVTATG